MKKLKHLVLFLFVFLIAFGGTKVFASGTVTIGIEGYWWTYKSEIMLDAMNELRTNSEQAWYWNEDNTTKTQFADNELCELTYDYGLEAVALQRAVEIVARWSHTRPNGGSVGDLLPSNVYWGENLAKGQTSWYDAFEALAEENEDYAGQGHRRNMLNPRFKSVGIARFHVDGVQYYVQVFSENAAANTTPPEGSNAYITKNVEILTSAITGGSPDIDGSISMDSNKNWLLTYGDTSIQIATNKARLRTTFTENPGTTKEVTNSVVFPYVTNVDVTFGTPGIVTLEADGTLKVLKAGTTTITCTYAAINNTNQYNIVASSLDLSNASVILDEGAKYYFTGSEIKPNISYIRVHNSFPVEGVDYTISYENNINAGDYGIVRLTGINGCVGTKEIKFYIYGKGISDCTIESIPNQNYTGSALKPAVTLKLGDYVLKEGTDYTLTYSSNINPGNATVSIKGIHNFYGTQTLNFNIIGTAPDDTNNTGTGNTGSSNTGTGNTGSGTTSNVLPKGTSVPLANGAKVTVTSPASTNKAGTVSYKPSKGAIILTIPDTITLNNLTYKVTSIPAGAFKNNTKLIKVTIGKYVTSIGSKAFYGCSKLTTVKIGKNVKTIGSYAFAKCTSLKKITIPSKVTKIGKYAFSGDKKLKSILIKSSSLKSVGKGALKNIYKKAVIKVPKKKLASYKKLLKNKGQAKTVTIKKR